MLINNNYFNTLIDNNIKFFINSNINSESSDNINNKIQIYYHNQMHEIAKKIKKNHNRNNQKICKKSKYLYKTEPIFIYYKKYKTL